MNILQRNVLHQVKNECVAIRSVIQIIDLLLFFPDHLKDRNDEKCLSNATVTLSQISSGEWFIESGAEFIKIKVHLFD